MLAQLENCQVVSINEGWSYRYWKPKRKDVTIAKILSRSRESREESQLKDFLLKDSGSKKRDDVIIINI